MGDCVSDRAKDFFSTMEQFQQNKKFAPNSISPGMMPALLGSMSQENLSQLLPMVGSKSGLHRLIPQTLQNFDESNIPTNEMTKPGQKSSEMKEDNEIYRMLQ